MIPLHAGTDRGDLEAGLRAPGGSARLHRAAAQQSTAVVASPAPADFAAGADRAGGSPSSGTLHRLPAGVLHQASWRQCKRQPTGSALHQRSTGILHHGVGAMCSPLMQSAILGSTCSVTEHLLHCQAFHLPSHSQHEQGAGPTLGCEASTAATPHTALQYSVCSGTCLHCHTVPCSQMSQPTASPTDMQTPRRPRQRHCSNPTLHPITASGLLPAYLSQLTPVRQHSHRLGNVQAAQCGEMRLLQCPRPCCLAPGTRRLSNWLRRKTTLLG